MRKNLFNYLQENSEKIKKVINFGISGKLNKDLKLDAIYSIESVSFYDEVIMETSLKLENQTNAKRCVTSIIPVSNFDLAESLSKIADMVDMELFEIVKISNSFNIPVLSFKLISDDAHSPVSANEIINKSNQFSDMLYARFKNDFL
ncbi:MAG: hypothetical protein HND50_01590 [Calditrichaeota bacterium]|nr:hypothetical protein [Calditrichota bacterium]